MHPLVAVLVPDVVWDHQVMEWDSALLAPFSCDLDLVLGPSFPVEPAVVFSEWDFPFIGFAVCLVGEFHVADCFVGAGGPVFGFELDVDQFGEPVGVVLASDVPWGHEVVEWDFAVVGDPLEWLGELGGLGLGLGDAGFVDSATCEGSRLDGFYSCHIGLLPFWAMRGIERLERSFRCAWH